MEKKSKFLPESLSALLRNLSLRASGLVLCFVAVWLILTLCFGSSYLSGFAVRGSFGGQGLFGYIVSFFRYVVGFIPSLFIFLCLVRFGLSLLIAWEEERAPEYNFLRGFVALCVGCAGLGLMFPSKSFGGLAGAIVGADLGSILYGARFPIGVILFALFLFMSGVLLHVKWQHVKSAWATTVALVKWLLSAFHIIKPVEADDDDVEEDEEVEDAPL